MYHLKLIKFKSKDMEAFNDFTHPIFFELGTTIDGEDEKYIWISDDDQLFINLDFYKIKKISSVFEKYFVIKINEVSKYILRGQFNLFTIPISCFEDDFFKNFKIKHTILDDVLDKINTKGLTSLDVIDYQILNTLN